MKYLVVLFLLSCATNGPVPMVPRPDTRNIGIVQLDSTVVRGTLEIFQRALPKEAAVCYQGVLRDTVIHDIDVLWLELISVTEAQADSSSEFYVWFPAIPRTGCAEAIATGHSHPHVGGNLCTHSDSDANVMFNDPRLLVSLVWCPDGRAQVLYQDGRRTDTRWRT